jgi:hypothetical protein
MALPLPDASKRLDAFSAHMFNQVNPWLMQHGPRVNGQDCPLFAELPDAQGISWGNMEGLKPFVRSAESGTNSFLVAGLLPENTTPQPSAAQKALFGELLGQTNLVYLGWEDTASRLDAWLPVSQTARALAGLAPLPTECLSLEWLAALRPRVGETKTTVIQSGPNLLQIHRESTTGFSASELHLIADWLESPKFPRGLYTFRGTAPSRD